MLFKVDSPEGVWFILFTLGGVLALCNGGSKPVIFMP